MRMDAGNHLQCLVTAMVLVGAFATTPSFCPEPGTTLSLTGSWVVQPIVSLWADYFDCPGVSIDVDRSNNDEGIARVCGMVANPTDMGVATRVLRSNEATKVDGEKELYQCVLSDRQVVAIDVALDGLVLVSVLGGAASNCLRSLESLTVDQVRWMFSNWTDTDLATGTPWNADSIQQSDGNPNTRHWCELSTTCPCAPIAIAGAPTGTRPHQYMQTSTGFDTAAFEDFRESYTAFEQREDLIRYLGRTESAVGFMRFAEYDRSQFLMDAVPVVDPATRTAVRPTAATIAGNLYQPYSRRAYLYVWTERMDDVLPFVEFGFSDTGTSLVDQVNLVPIPSSEREDILQVLQQPLLLPSGSAGSGDVWGFLWHSMLPVVSWLFIV